MPRETPDALTLSLAQLKILVRAVGREMATYAGIPERQDRFDQARAVGEVVEAAMLRGEAMVRAGREGVDGE